ncbi:MAG: hypothetical protein ABI443_07910 [Chthoniobacterales bacterium]
MNTHPSRNASSDVLARKCTACSGACFKKTLNACATAPGNRNETKAPAFNAAQQAMRR